MSAPTNFSLSGYVYIGFFWVRLERINVLIRFGGRESLIINEASREILNSIVGMRGNPVNGIFIAGPVSKAQSNDCERILLEIRALPQSGSNPYLSGVSIVGDFIVARYLGDCTEQAKHYFTGLWQILRPFILERKICKPRIWAT